MSFRFKISFDQWRLIAVAILGLFGISLAPHWSGLLFIAAAIVVNLWVLHSHLFIRIGKFEWGNREFDL